eukprot:4107953-Amphidinium_carterae.1
MCRPRPRSHLLVGRRPVKLRRWLPTHVSSRRPGGYAVQQRKPQWFFSSTAASTHFICHEKVTT